MIFNCVHSMHVHVEDYNANVRQEMPQWLILVHVHACCLYSTISLVFTHTSKLISPLRFEYTCQAEGVAERLIYKGVV